MVIRGIHHIAINAKNIDESVKFYKEILGLRQSTAVDFDDFTLVYFDIPGGGCLELFDCKGRPLEPAKDAENSVGLRHIAFEVDNVLEFEKKLRESKVDIVLAPTKLPNLGLMVMLFKDPNGVVIEICEPLQKSKR